MYELEKDPNTGNWVIYGTKAELHALMTNEEIFYSVFKQIPEKDRTLMVFEAFLPAFRILLDEMRRLRDK